MRLVLGTVNTQQPQVAMEYRSIMLDYIAMIALILLIAGHTILIKKCKILEGEIPLHFHDFGVKADVIDSNLQQVRDLLDEALDMLMPIAQPQVPSQPQNMSMGETIASVLLSRLIPPTAMPEVDASTTQQKQREIYEVHPTTTLDTEDEPIEYSPVSIDG